MSGEFEVSSADKVLFPAAGITKGEVVAHYERVAPRMFPHVAGRPLTLHRFPGGIGDEGFFQKNAADYFPDSMGRLPIPKRDGGTTEYPVITERWHIPYLANQNTITFHVWTARLPDLGRPDRLVFDLDPEEGDVGPVREATHMVGDLLAEVGLGRGVPMTTGSKGFHVVVPIVADTDYERVATFARNIAELAAHRHPERLTTEFRIAKREGRVFVDWLRNRGGSTGVAPWSLRARPGAPVAVPIRWEQVEDVVPHQWTLRTIGEALATPDALAEVEPVRLGLSLAAAQSLVDDAGIELEPFDRFRS